MTFFRRVLVLLSLVATFAAAGSMSPAAAQSGARKDLVIATLVPEHASLVPGQVLWLDLHFDIKPGWHTYWRNPGDSGLATRIDWHLPSPLAAGEALWPKPEKFLLASIGTYGYAGRADLLTPISVPASMTPGGQATISAHASWLVCADICIPGDQDLTLNLPVTPSPAATTPETGQLFQAARASLPQPARFEALYSSEGGNYALWVPASAFAGLTKPDAAFFPFDGNLIQHAAPENPARSGNGIVLTLPKSDAGAHPATLDGVVVVSGQDADGKPVSRQFTISANPAAASGAIGDSSQAAPGIDPWAALFLAFLGGIVLNAMPCVFPVLSLKVLALTRSAHESGRHRFNEAAAYTLGVLLSFLILGGSLLAFRLAGHAVGWGFQLQSPVFVACLAYLIFLMGLGLSGVMELGTSLANIGSRFALSSGVAGSFMTGVLATIVATPCTGPFMGAALGTALVAPLWVGLGIFLALGAGLAAPYLMLASIPGLRRLLPKPGAWMVTLRQFLAFPLYGTAAWLFWVLLQQVSPQAALAALTGFVILAFAAWIFGRTRFSAPAARWIGAALAGAAVAIVLFLAISLGAPGSMAASLAGAKSDGGGLAYEPFSTARLAALRAAGKPIFVNLTAAWCLTCQVNERLTLDRPALRKLFADKHITALKGDWTNQNPEITGFLQKFGRSGVPLYLVYDGKTDPIILPQILTEAQIRDQFRPN